jgi:hypothetical protein
MATKLLLFVVDECNGFAAGGCTHNNRRVQPEPRQRAAVTATLCGVRPPAHSITRQP